MNTIEKLDFMLECINGGAKSFLEMEPLFISSKKEYVLTQEEYDKLIEQLQKRDFIDLGTEITLKGEYRLDLNKERNHNIQLQNNIVEMQKTNLLLTYILAISSSIVTLYYVVKGFLWIVQEMFLSYLSNIR